MAIRELSDWSECNECGTCFIMCPSMKMGKGQAREEIARLRSGAPTRRVMSECLLCMRCNSNCPRGLRPYDLILKRMWERNVAAGRVSAIAPYFMTGTPGPALWSDVYATMSPAENEIIKSWGEAPPPGTKEVLFVGCNGRMFCGDIERSRALASLPKYGPADLCCGEMHYRAGDWDAYERVASDMLSRFETLGVERMVSYCASCQVFIEEMAPRALGRELPFEVVSIFDWLSDKVDAGELEFVRSLGDRQVLLQESCSSVELGRAHGEAMRRLYREAGAQIIEFASKGSKGLCCGAASAARRFSIFDIIAEQGRKFAEIKSTGTRTVAANCLGCYYTMDTIGLLHGVRMTYLVEDILYALGDEQSTRAASRSGVITRSILRRLPGRTGRLQGGTFGAIPGK